VRDAVIDYATHMVTIAPTIEGRLDFLNLTFKSFLPWVSR
jgi:hypothetical protein